MSFIIILDYFSITYNRTAANLEYLSHNLENEAELQTKRLQKANDGLERDREIFRKDMYMAALVQKKFFHAPMHSLRHCVFL